MKKFRKLLKRVGPGSNDTGESGSNDTGKSNTEQNIHKIQSKHNIVREVYGSAPSTAREAGEEFQAKKTITNNPIKESTSTPHESTEIEHISSISGETGENARGTEVSIQPSQDIRRGLLDQWPRFSDQQRKDFIREAWLIGALDSTEAERYTQMIEKKQTFGSEDLSKLVDTVEGKVTRLLSSKETVASWVQQFAEADQSRPHIEPGLFRQWPGFSDQKRKDFIREAQSVGALDGTKKESYTPMIEEATFGQQQPIALVYTVGDWVKRFPQMVETVASWVQQFAEIDQRKQETIRELSRQLPQFSPQLKGDFILTAELSHALDNKQAFECRQMIEKGTFDSQSQEFNEFVQAVGDWAGDSAQNKEKVAGWLQRFAELDQPRHDTIRELSRQFPQFSVPRMEQFITDAWLAGALDDNQVQKCADIIKGENYSRQELNALAQEIGDWMGKSRYERESSEKRERVATWLLQDRIADQPGIIRDISRRLPEFSYREAEEKLELMLKITQHLLEDTREILHGTSSIRQQQRNDLSSIVNDTYYRAIDASYNKLEASYNKLKGPSIHLRDHHRYAEYNERKRILLNNLENIADCYIETFNYKNSIDYAAAIIDKEHDESKFSFKEIGEIAGQFLRPRQVERYYKKEFDKFWRRKAEKQGDCIEPEETHIRERLIKDTRAWWRCQPETLLKIVKETGRAMTTFEPGTEPSFIREDPERSQAAYTAKRARIEVGIEGYPEDMPPGLRPLGMYITDDAFGSLGQNKVDRFGPVAILWDKELLDCTQLVLGAYLPAASDGETRLEVKPVPHSDPDIQSYPLKTPELYEQENGNVPSDYSSVHNIPFWVEGRMPVALAKKERMSLVVFRNKLDNSKLMKQLQIALDENNIPWVVMSGDKVFQHSKSYEIWLRENPNSKYRIDKSNIESALAKEPFEPKQLINTFKQNSFLKQQFEAKTGVVEGYILEEHAEMNMTQFEKYFAKKFKSPLLTKSQWRVKNALDDIGKPEAFRVTGKTSMQHKYTGSIMRELLRQLEIPQERAKIMVSLATHDYIGQYMKGEVSDPKEVATSIILEARRLNVDTDEYFELCKISYTCDAGSYTEDAGGKKSLDHLFVFNPDSETMKFSSQTREKFNELVKHTERLYMNDVGDTLLTISGRISSRHIKELNKHNIGYVVDMRSEGCDDAQELAKQNIEFFRIPIDNRGAPTIDQLLEATNRVNERLKIMKNMKDKNDRKKVLIHDTYGKGRSPLLVCAVLVSQGMTAQKALDTVTKYRTQAELSPEQWKRLNEFEQHLKDMMGQQQDTKRSTSLWKEFRKGGK